MAIAAGMVLLTACGSSEGPQENQTTSATTAASAPRSADVSAADRLDQAYIDDEASDLAYWQRAVELLGEQDSAVLTSTGDVNIRITREGESVTLYRDDLGSIAFNSCSDIVHSKKPAETVGWIKDTFEVQRRWEAAQLRLAALQTKCPSLQ